MPTTDSELNVVPSPGVLAEDTGKTRRLLAFRDICSTRDFTWNFANQIRSLDDLARDVALDAHDALTGALGRAILTVA